VTQQEAWNLHAGNLARGASLAHMTCKAFNAIQFRDHAERITPSEQRLNGAIAELRLTGRM
jgi:hypothetical protein